MTKSICALAHRKGSTREAFQRYYEENHAPLAIGLFPFSGYARNHLIDGDDFGWDTISEFWSEDIERAAALMDGPIGDTMRADEERFMDRSVIASGGAREVIVSAGERADAGGRRTALLIERAPPGDDAGGTILAWAQALAHGLAPGDGGVSVDFVQSWGQPAFPALAVIWLPGHRHVESAPRGLVVRELHVRRAETPPSALLGAPR